MTANILKNAMAFIADGNWTQAETLLHDILADNPKDAQAHFGKGLVELERNKTESAIDHFKQAINSDPEHIEAFAALGSAFIQAGHPAKATTILAEAVKRAPQVLEPRLHLARAYGATGHHTESLHVLTDTTELFPHSANAWRLKGRAERVLNDADAAYRSCAKAADLAPDDAGIRNDYGVACRAAGKIVEAAKQYEAAIRLQPDLAIAHANLGNVLDLAGDLEGAEHALRQALQLDPATPDGSYNLACLLTKMENPEDAAPLFKAIAESTPDRWDVHTNLGVTHLSLGQLEHAEAALRRALTLNPANPEAHYNLAWLLLLTDRHQEGWVELEWRWQLPEFSSLQRTYDMPAWDGTPLEDGTIYLHAEQGLGDTLQFIRFIDPVKNKCTQVTLGCQKPLIPLLQGIDGLNEIVPLEQIPPAASAHAPLLSLPRLLEFDGTDTPHPGGYLTAPKSFDDRLRVPETGRRRIGLVWAGSPDNKIELRRKIDPSLFLPLFEATEADFIGLQVGSAAGDASHFPKDRITFTCDSVVEDFADTAAVIAQLDLVIGVDTSVIHLSGALGVPTWTILPYMPDYRWGLGSESTRWYDSMRLFRQPARGDWTAVMRGISDALRSW